MRKATHASSRRGRVDATIDMKSKAATSDCKQMPEGSRQMLLRCVMLTLGLADLSIAGASNSLGIIRSREWESSIGMML